jgi:hypothetical protein
MWSYNVPTCTDGVKDSQWSANVAINSQEFGELYQ